MKYVEYVESLGFSGVKAKPIKTNAGTNELRLLSFVSFDPVKTRAMLGRPKLHKKNLFVFTFSKSRAIRVDTLKKHVMLANSERVVSRFMESVYEES